MRDATARKEKDDQDDQLYAHGLHDRGVCRHNVLHRNGEQEVSVQEHQVVFSRTFDVEISACLQHVQTAPHRVVGEGIKSPLRRSYRNSLDQQDRC